LRFSRCMVAAPSRTVCSARPGATHEQLPGLQRRQLAAAGVVD
jgi:hypothetical protein